MSDYQRIGHRFKSWMMTISTKMHSKYLTGCPALLGTKKDFFRDFFWKGKKQLSPMNFEVYFNMYLRCIFQHEIINYCKFISLFPEPLATAVSNRKDAARKSCPKQKKNQKNG